MQSYTHWKDSIVQQVENSNFAAIRILQYNHKVYVKMKQISMPAGKKWKHWSSMCEAIRAKYYSMN